MTQRFHIANMGCRSNLYDGHVLQQELVARGWRPAAGGDDAEVVIINSCTVTAQADRDSAKLANRLRRRFADAKIIMTGCGAEIAPDRMAQLEAVDQVVGNQDKHRFAELVLDTPDAAQGVLGSVAPYGSMKPRHEPSRAWPAAGTVFETPLEGGVRTRTFLKVQEGCDAFCTFCVIPYARGPGRSLRPSEVIGQVREVHETGTHEVVLTGTALDTWGHDLGDDLAFDSLVGAVLKETSIARLRLPSLDPVALSPALRDLMVREPRLCPHAHVALQSPHTDILRRMKRRYDGDAVEEALWGLHAAGETLEASRGLVGGVFVGMDIITGFPGESREIFQWTVEQLERLPWHRLHVFPYSERSGTAATRLDGVVPVAERRERVRTLMRLSLARLVSHYEAVASRGAPMHVIVERVDDGVGRGTTDNYYRVRFPLEGRPIERNQWATVRPHSVRVSAQRGEAELEATFVS